MLGWMLSWGCALPPSDLFVPPSGQIAATLSVTHGDLGDEVRLSLHSPRQPPDGWTAAQLDRCTPGNSAGGGVGVGFPFLIPRAQEAWVWVDGTAMPLAGDEEGREFEVSGLDVHRATLGVGFTPEDEEDEHLPAFDEVDLFEVPNLLDVFTPQGDATLDPTKDLPFRWTRGSPDGILTIVLRQTTGDEANPIVCLAMDDGRFVVPASDLDGFEGPVTVSVTRQLRTYHELAAELHLQASVIDRTSLSASFAPR